MAQDKKPTPAPHISQAKGQSASAALTQRKRFRRQWLTFMRMIQYGLSNFSRNAWLTTAATAVMTVTLLIVFSTVAARNIFGDTIMDLREKLDISFYLKDDVTPLESEKLMDELREQPLVKSVRFISKEDAQRAFAKDSGKNRAQIEALQSLDGKNPLPQSLRIEVYDTNRLNELDAVFKQKEFKDAQNEKRQPTTTGSRRITIDTIAKAATFTERAGLVLCGVSVIISILIIFNTIRMAIFNRRDEIQMMKLIGADKGFIKGPFIFEAMMYGILAGCITLAIAYPLLLTQAEKLSEYGVAIAPTLELSRQYWYIVGASVLALGAMIGIVSSLLAIRRYLKV